MRTRRLGRSGIEVSVVGLGCNNFGRRTDEETSRAVIDAAIDVGITFFDTADTYGDGASEEIIGRALEGRRERVVLATKFGGGGATGRGQGSRDYVLQAVEASLARLRTDWIDLYQHHQEDPDTPLAETIGALDELVREGRIRAYGTSNHSPTSLEEAASLAQEAYVSEQSQYSLLRPDAEHELLPTCERLDISFIPYFPLASGLLTGKVRRDRPPEPGTRLHGREISETDLEEVERLSAVAAELGVSLLELAVGALAAQPVIASVIAGATRPDQVRANAEAGRWEPSERDLDAIRAATA
ncbi:MAG TPA: aldo/keto reductase [Gaiellaceae bacterium]|jgi:aryl-alcohol dehydrogenase-like predicted oxidoreductase|nr:aldo/keto reductase [Gaiellaceae bacterium]